LGPIGRAQPPVSPPAPDVVLTTRFVTPFTYEAALSRLAGYYDDQVGRKLTVAFPEIAPRCHFEVWHDLWVFFGPAAAQTTVTLKRPTAGNASRLVKSWMLDLAGRLEAPMPLEFQEEPPLHAVESDIEASRNDLARALGSATSMRPVTTWQHAGMMVSAAPLTWVVLAPAGLHGVHHVTVAAESAAASRLLLAKVMQGVSQPGIYGIYSEEVELGEEVRNRASGKSAEAGVASPRALYIPNMDEKYLEGKVRADPEMIKRSAAALGQYAVRFRVDKSYRKVTVSWMELAGYARATGKYDGERALGQSALANPKLPPRDGSPVTARTKLPTLAPGAYRVRLEGESAAAQAEKIDERCYWFDGKTFEEL
jgi:5-hydroxyisourate hydrolase-like protein (transthyretin family)